MILMFAYTLGDDLVSWDRPWWFKIGAGILAPLGALAFLACVFGFPILAVWAAGQLWGN